MADVQADSVACRYCPGLLGSLPLRSCAAVPRTQTRFYFSSSSSFLSQYIHRSTPHGLSLPLGSKLLQGHLGKGLKQLQTDLKSAGSAVWFMTPGQRPPLSLIQSSSLSPPFLSVDFLSVSQILVHSIPYSTTHGSLPEEASGYGSAFPWMALSKPLLTNTSQIF